MPGLLIWFGSWTFGGLPNKGVPLLQIFTVYASRIDCIYIIGTSSSWTIEEEYTFAKHQYLLIVLGLSHSPSNLNN